jgi:hypothetical protein
VAVSYFNIADPARGFDITAECPPHFGFGGLDGVPEWLPLSGKTGPDGRLQQTWSRWLPSLPFPF